MPAGAGLHGEERTDPEKKTARGRLDRDATLRALYKEGKNDREISDLLGYSTGAILNWRQRHGYQANYKGGRPKKLTQE